ncbi:autotransporter outer membrane beta-barrel domain-containing protein [Poseidonibacter lekithochrous]|uniref:autotransporter family protein n=1 Tax=Poseidonibacter lekithochrous TaxID=1904463 RepID=UPI0008FC5B5A|nr:autotransporter outer membrane beta-barrel domain-containing protein [Poseidonibacter lekithochrous]QKJ21667.1 autotransporter domain-containing protein [Poseidonibacter lekithochrous]
MKTKKIIISSIIISSTLFAQSFDASNYGLQNDLLYGLTNTLTKPIDSNIDTLLFKNGGSNDFFYFKRNTEGSVAPDTLTAFEENRAYQNLIFENTSTSNTWTLGSQNSQASCNPCNENHVFVSTKSLTLNNTALEFIKLKSPDVDPNANRYDWIEDFVFQNSQDYARLNLNNGHLLLDNNFGSGALISFRNNTIFDINGKDNVIKGASGAFGRSLHELYLNINKNSSLIINGTTNLQALEYGHINMQEGSSLLVKDSRLQLTSDGTNSKYFSTFDNASVSVSGVFGSTPSSLEITNPTFTNSNISLGNNTKIRSVKRVNSSFLSGDFFFEGNNDLVLNSGSKLTGNESLGNDTSTGFNFSNGTTNISGAGTLDALDMHLNNAKVEYSGNNISTNLKSLYLNNGSELKTSKSTSDDFNKLLVLNINDSTLNGNNSYGLSAVLRAQIENSTLKIDTANRTSGMTFHLAGINDPSIDGYIKFDGNNKFISRIDPSGKDIGAGIKNYADAIYFKRRDLGSFTSDTVLGLSNLDVELEAFSSSPSSTDYSSGGENSDGIYDVMVFQSTATADSDNVDFILGGSMPALLKATQVKTPSADNLVSVKLETQTLSSLTSHPTITTSNQQNGLNLLLNGANSGNTNINNALQSITNSQLQTHTDSIHAEPYSSYMTISLEHTDMIMNSVLNNTALNMNISSGKLDKKIDHNKKKFWMDISHSKGDIDGSSGLGSFDYTLNTVTFGNDFISDENKRAGMFISFGTQKMDEHDSVNQDFNSDNYYVGGYINQNISNNWNIGSVFGYGYGKHKSTRTVQLSNLNGNSNGNFHSHSIYGAINISKNIFSNDLVSLRPEAGFDYAYYKQEEIKESGDSNFNLIIDKTDAQSIVGSIGINAKFKSISDTNKIYPLAFVKYEHDFYANRNNAHKVNAALSSNSNYKQEFEGQNRGENSILTGIGLASDINNSLQINGGFVYSRHSHGKEVGAGISLKYKF